MEYSKAPNIEGVNDERIIGQEKKDNVCDNKMNKIKENPGMGANVKKIWQ